LSIFLFILATIGLVMLIGTIILFRRVFIDMAADGLHKPGGSHTNNLKKSRAAVDGCMSAIVLIFGPTILFILAYEYGPVERADRIIGASFALAAAVLAAVLYRLARPIPKKTKFPWRNLAIIAFAGATVALPDPLFVQLRPTVTNVVAAVLAVGSLVGIGPGLEALIEKDKVALEEAGWRKMTLGSALLFLTLAAVNEYVRHYQSEAFWVYFQLWGPPLLFQAFLIVGFLVIKGHFPAGQCPAKSRAEPPEPSNDH
jgi:intracellular septation protein A